MKAKSKPLNEGAAKMTPKNHQTENDAYIDFVINSYIQLPDTPGKPSQNDRFTATAFRSQGINIHTVESALLLASVRRLARPDDAAPLPPVRSLAYFTPVVRELADSPLPDGYLIYLRDKLQRLRSR
jgi:hypothetical protein